MGNLGRRKPVDWKHVERYSLSDLRPTIPEVVEHSIRLPAWHWEWDQGNEGACVGFGTTFMMSLLNRRRYDPLWLYHEAQLVDPWDDTPPASGTAVSAACDVLRDKGHARYYDGVTHEPNLIDGINENRWATTVDEIRYSISQNIPVSIGIDWYRGFDTPIHRTGGYFLPYPANVGTLRGGHCVCIYGASDQYQAFRFKNSWGRSYPLAMIPYKTMQFLLDAEGEASLVVDRV